MPLTPPPPPASWCPRTVATRGGLQRSQFLETDEAIFMTSGFVYGSAEEAEAAFANEGQRFVYSRYANPTVSMFEERLRLIEGAEMCRATGSGMAAVFAALACFLKAGDRVVASRALFGSCLYILTQILPRFGVTTELVDGRDRGAWEKALAKGARAVFVESPSNPTLEIIDLKAVADLTHAKGALLIVDNVFASPLLQKPLAFGADIVVYSATKHIDGQGRSLGGAILGPKSFFDDYLLNFLRHTGPSLSPFNAWLLVKALETLEMRVRRQCDVALAVAQFLEKHPKVKRTLYPGLASHPQHALATKQMTGFGTVVCFEAGTSKQSAFRVMNALKIFDISNNLGDTKSLSTHPATTTHRRLSPEERAATGITDAFIRLSAGIEDEADLIGDLDQALAQI